MHWEWRPGDRFGRVAPWITSYHGTPLTIVGDQVVGVITDDATESAVDDDGSAMRGTFTVEPGNHRTIALVSSDREPLFIPDLAAVDERLNATIQYWCRWSHGLTNAGPWASVVERSALALKLLLAEDTGAIAAAATTSLPERIGGPKNWDYRFAWVRDTSFTQDALINLGLHEEVQRSVAWLVDAIGRNGPGLHVFYTLGGEVHSDQEELHARGTRIADRYSPATVPLSKPSSGPMATFSTRSGGIANRATSSTHTPLVCSPAWLISAVTPGGIPMPDSGSSRSVSTTPSRRSAAGLPWTEPAVWRRGPDRRRSLSTLAR